MRRDQSGAARPTKTLRSAARAVGIAAVVWLLTGWVAPSVAFAQAALEGFLGELDDVLTLDEDGKKGAVKFAHKDHASGAYLPDGECVTCHHTQEGDAKPEPCYGCHAIGGEAEERRAKTRASHAKKLGFPKASGAEQVSCVGCHISQNERLEAGQREGESAPTRCKSCHVK